MWILPSRGRPENLRRFVNAAREMGTSTPGTIVVDKDDNVRHGAAYAEITRLLPPGWRFKVIESSGYGNAVRAMWDETKDLAWVGLVSDDLLPSVSKWDTTLITGLNGYNVVSSNDGWQANADIRQARIHGAAVWSGDLLRAVGWLFPDGLDHVFHDDVWENLGRATGCWIVNMQVMVRHLHESLGGVIGPTMDRQSGLWKHDEAWYVEWQASGMHHVVARIEALKTARGVRQIGYDFKGVKLMIATPSGSGTYEGTYMESLYATTQALSAWGADVMWVKQQYLAEVDLARAKLFAAFVRSSCTHMLSIDDDMGWDIAAVIRLFYANKDAVAVAGPKKRYPLQFAANRTDERGNPLELQFDPDSLTMEVNEVGAAFMLITKAMALRMVEAYPDLTYTGETGETEWAVYQPMLEHGRRFGEDFAFCRRWTKLGGAIHVCADVPLKHTGGHQFEGALSQVMQATIPQMAEPMAQAAE